MRCLSLSPERSEGSAVFFNYSTFRATEPLPEGCHPEEYRDEGSASRRTSIFMMRNSRFLAPLRMTKRFEGVCVKQGAAFLRFNLVGAIGVAIQLALLALLTRVFGLGYLWATALAVATTVVHNFAWHERFTFYDRLHDRSSRTARAMAGRFLKFNLVTGLISIGGNVVLMHWLRGRARLPLVVANLVAIAVCSVFNYVANDRLVFRCAK